MRLFQRLFFLLAVLLPAVHAAILAIDYGAEFTKLSLVKPGVPFDVLLDKDSKRKISSVVGWKRNDRVYGAEGKMSVSNYRSLQCAMLTSRQLASQIPTTLTSSPSSHPRIFPN